MSEEHEAAGERQDMMGVLLGKMALDREFITQDQLREALMEQGSDVEERGMARPLGLILVAKGYLSEPLLLTLLEEQRALNLDPERSRKRDHSLGQVLLKRGKITEEQLNECIRIQGEAIEANAPEIPRIGELLVEKGYTTAREVTLALASQKKVMLACEKCGKRFNAVGYTPTKRYHCKFCQGYLVPLSEYNSTRVDADMSFDATMGTPAGGTPAVQGDLVLTTPTPGATPAVQAPLGSDATPAGGVTPPPTPAVASPASQPVARIVKVKNPWVPVLWIGAAVILGLAATAYLALKLFK
jgi:hypothetical protein